MNRAAGFSYFTLPQRKAYARLEEHGTLIAFDSQTMNILKALVTKGLAMKDPSRENTFHLVEDLPDRQLRFLERHGWIRKCDRKPERPPAEYSNRTREQLIDQILKNN